MASLAFYRLYKKRWCHQTDEVRFYSDICYGLLWTRRYYLGWKLPAITLRYCQSTEVCLVGFGGSFGYTFCRQPTLWLHDLCPHDSDIDFFKEFLYNYIISVAYEKTVGRNYTKKDLSKFLSQRWFRYHHNLQTIIPLPLLLRYFKAIILAFYIKF